MTSTHSARKTMEKRFFAATGIAAVLVFGAVSGAATTRPHYGGTLRVEMRERVPSLDPRDFPDDTVRAAAAQKLAALIYDRLVILDENGQPQPALATFWQHDAQFKRWRFAIRTSVQFHDGTPMTAPTLAGWWNQMGGTERLAGATGDVLWIQSEQPMPNLLVELAEGRNFVFRTGKGSLVGTGAFRVKEWAPGRKLVLTANEEYWGGRPYIDGVSIEMGANAAQQRIDLELGRADVVELDPSQARRATQDGRRVWSSEPVELYALVFDTSRAVAADARVRQAISLAVDRAAICNVLLQRQGEPAGGLLPQWLSGYAFLFEVAAEGQRIDKAKDIVKKISPAPRSITLSYSAADPLARTIAERVSLNARDAGLTVQVPAEASPNPDARLVRLRLGTIDAARALESLAAASGEAHAAQSQAEAAADPGQLYAAERAVIDEAHIVPLVYMPETAGLSARVRNWMAFRWGEWRLADVWLDSSAAQGAALPAPQGGAPR